MKKFHIAIKNNETGKILYNVDTDAIIGAIHEEDKSAAIGLSACSSKALLATVLTAKTAIKTIISNTPALAMLDKFGLLDVLSLEEPEKDN